MDNPTQTKSFTPAVRCPSCFKETDWAKVLTTDSGNIFACRHCNTARKDEINAEKIYYQNSQDMETLSSDSEVYIKEGLVHTLEAGRIIKTIDSFASNKKGKLLDLGCAAGFLLKTAYEDGWEITGVDKNSIFTEYAKNSLKLNNIFNTGIDDFLNTNIDKKFNVVIYKNVLAHLNNPGEAIMNASRHQDRGDLIFLQTPNLSNLWLTIKINRIRRHWPYFNTYLWFFNPKSITMLLENCGYKVKRIENFPLYVSISLFTQRFCERFFIQTLKEGDFRNKVWRINQKAVDIMRKLGFNRICMKIKFLNDIMNVYAIKD